MNNYCPIQNSKCGGPSYNPDKWELSVDDHEINNCYSYVMNIMETDIIEKRQPGEKCNLEFEYDCKNIEKMMQCDFPSITKLDNIDTEIPCDHYRIALVLDKKGEHLDYHFYRQDLNGYWSHKTGHDPITNLDASNNIISNPEKIDRNYDKDKNDQFNYDIFCGYYSVKYII
tara:strand:+ start:994 stop:1509 length:516 start_codon:yes stop_codon:yes gene_type:complete